MAAVVPLLAGFAGQAAATGMATAAGIAAGTTAYSMIASIGFMAGSAMASAFLAPDMPDVQGPRATENKVQVSTYGAFISIPYGRVRLAGNIIWDYGICEQVTTEEQGGKGGGGAEVTTYTYFDSWAVGLCEGKVSTIHKIWFDSNLVFDAEVADVNEVIKDKFEIYYGDEYQEPDPLIEAVVGLYKAPAYRGICYIVFDNIHLTDFGNRIPNITVELTRSPDVSVSSEIYPIESGDSLIQSAAIINLRQHMSYYSDNIDVSQLSILSANMFPVVDYKAYGMVTESVDIRQMTLLSANMFPIVDYVNYDFGVEAVNLNLMSIVSGSMHE